MSKKNILIISGIVIGVIILFLISIPIKKFINEVLEEETELNWHLISLNDDSRKNFFIKEYKPSEEVIKLMDIQNASTDNIKFIERRSGDTEIEVGKDGNKSKVTVLDSRKSIYRPEGKDPSFKIWVEELNNDDFLTYKEKMWDDIESYNGSTAQNFEYQGHDYYIYYRDDASNVALQRASSIGGSYIFFDDMNIIVFLNFFNTKYQGCLDGQGPNCKFYDNEKILTIEDIKLIVEKLIDEA